MPDERRSNDISRKVGCKFCTNNYLFLERDKREILKGERKGDTEYIYKLKCSACGQEQRRPLTFAELKEWRS